MIDPLAMLATAVLTLAWAPLACAVGYLLLLTVAAARRSDPLPAARDERIFRIIVPAHDEELVLAPVLRRLLALDYPRSRFEVVVVADNCTDRTAEVARSCGARVFERSDPTARGKGHALAHAFAALKHEVFDAYVVLDADTLAGPQLLQVFNRYISAGKRVIQAHYDVHDPFSNRRTALMYVALRIFHYVRPLGRRALGCSATLTGNGMCFRKDVIDRQPWNAFSITEDLEYTSQLIHQGERIAFAPEAPIWAQMPTTRSQASSQRQRWEGGRFQLARRDGLRSLLLGLRRRDLRLIDWAMDLLIPPLAALVLATGAGTSLAIGAALLLTTPMLIAVMWAWINLIGAVAVFVVAALIVGRVPRPAYVALLHAPGYVLWKLWMYLVMATRRAPRTWVRTERARLHDA